jgi:hypothetical protein
MDIVGDSLYTFVGDQKLQFFNLVKSGIDLPPGNSRIPIDFVSSRYVAFHIPWKWNDLKGLRDRTLWVFDRQTSQWKKISQPGSTSRTKLVGPWVVTIQQQARQLEDQGGAVVVKCLPSDRSDSYTQGESAWTKREYGCWQSAWSELPGILILDNLEDGRRIVINTGREDSEVLLATATDVIYRVNDEILQAPITASKIGSASLIAKDDNVPQVHWAFFSKATK